MKIFLVYIPFSKIRSQDDINNMLFGLFGENYIYCSIQNNSKNYKVIVYVKDYQYDNFEVRVKSPHKANRFKLFFNLL